jgi:phosphoglycolate phosphatase
MFRLIVFDWDGTLADSLNHIVQSMQQAMQDMQLETCPVEQIRAIIGLGLDEGIRILCPELNAIQRNALCDGYRYHYLADKTIKTSIYPEVSGMLEKLRGDDLLLAVATGKSRKGLNRALLESGLETIFHHTRCADETFSKPHPRMLLDIMAKLDVPAEETLLIGDSIHDLAMAINAGIASAAVTYGACSEQHLLEFNPLVCFASLAELPEWLQSR